MSDDNILFEKFKREMSQNGFNIDEIGDKKGQSSLLDDLKKQVNNPKCHKHTNHSDFCRHRSHCLTLEDDKPDNPKSRE